MSTFWFRKNFLCFGHCIVLFSRFSGFWNRQVVCQAPFFRKQTRPLPLMSLAQAALHQKRLKRFIEWRQTLNWEMNNRKIHQREGSHLNLQVQWSLQEKPIQCLPKEMRGTLCDKRRWFCSHFTFFSEINVLQSMSMYFKNELISQIFCKKVVGKSQFSHYVSLRF